MICSLQLYSLHIAAASQVIQAAVSYQGAVVQLQHGQVLLGTGRGAQVADTLVSDQLAVGEGERPQLRTMSGQHNERGVRYENTFVKIHPGKMYAGTR